MDDDRLSLLLDLLLEHSLGRNLTSYFATLARAMLCSSTLTTHDLSYSA